MKKTITTIIPFFNSESTIARAIDSVLAQTYPCAQLILVDDGSTDSSLEICQKYAKSYDNVELYHQNHSGISDTRNYGITKATSDYIHFVDADDSLAHDMYECFISEIEKTNANIAVCGYNTISNTNVEPHLASISSTFSSSEMLEYMFTDENISGFSWNRLFPRELFNKYSFSKELPLCEDLALQAQVYSDQELSFTYIKKPLYNYYKNTNSATESASLFRERTFAYQPAFKEILNIIDAPYVTQKYNEILNYSLYRQIKLYKSGNKSLSDEIYMLCKEASKYQKPIKVYLKALKLFLTL